MTGKAALRWQGETRKGSEIMGIADTNGLPVAVCVVTASPNEAS